eukprot:jgi/Psemu1/324222/estExt_fgenesh1_pg.C_1280006
MDPSDRIEEAHATTIRTTTPQTSIGSRSGRCSTSSAVTLRSATTAETDTTTLSNDDNDDNENDGDNVDVDNYYDANWKDSPLVNPRITFDTLLVPSSQLTKWITHPELQHRLAKPDNWEFLKHVHPRIKMVQDYVDEDEDNSDRDSNRSTKDKKGGGGGGLFKQLLLLPSSVLHENANQTATGMAPSDSQDEHETERGSSDDDDDARPVTATATIQKGPALTMPIAYHQLSFQYLLRRLLPESAYPVPSAYEQIGHVAHFNLRERHLPYRKLIGEAIEYMARSITANGMDKEKDGQSMYHRFDLSCRDSYDFLFELGEEQPSVSKAKRLEQEHLEKSTSRRPWYPRFHVYTFAWSSEPRVGDEEEMAINLVANELIPPYVFSDTASDASDDNGDGDADADAAPAIYRRAELDDEFGTDISTRMVRDVAPGKVVVCVSFSVTPKLIRYMQGDYS